MRLPFRTLSALALLCLVALVPLLTSDYYTGLIIKIMIYSLFALSLQLLVGGVGLVSLGHAAFFGGAAPSKLLPQNRRDLLRWFCGSNFTTRRS